MREDAAALLLIVMVVGAWLGCLGFARLRVAMDRLHCVTFVNLVCGIALLGAALVVDGPSDRVLKVFFIVVLNLVNGAGISHATVRAVKWRGQQ